MHTPWRTSWLYYELHHVPKAIEHSDATALILNETIMIDRQRAMKFEQHVTGVTNKLRISVAIVALLIVTVTINRIINYLPVAWLKNSQVDWTKARLGEC